jgi:hypothetical protein
MLKRIKLFARQSLAGKMVHSRFLDRITWGKSPQCDARFADGYPNDLSGGQVFLELAVRNFGVPGHKREDNLFLIRRTNPSCLMTDESLANGRGSDVHLPCDLTLDDYRSRLQHTREGRHPSRQRIRPHPMRLVQVAGVPLYPLFLYSPSQPYAHSSRNRVQ